MGRRRERALQVAEGGVRYWSPKGACAIGLACAVCAPKALNIAEGNVQRFRAIGYALALTRLLITRQIMLALFSATYLSQLRLQCPN